ncbi:MAG TPA: TetR/AcrR family transcriptional regulator [Sphingopyxis sp.]|uniref:TetR/AcrR family transcriptional regulator n=1 Tax=Sphingopyxis sp. TaxID=1908224 RepID=UPI002E0F47B5|nr:TetR/AcrR family transcriptional regulator [Sphingopyxis sp.]
MITMKTVSTSAAPARRRIGRPLSFDRDQALEAAMHVFWRNGYETSSIADLTAAMGITPPSLYTAFGDKKQLFLEAVDRYAGDISALSSVFADAATARDAARNLLHATAVAFTGETTPRGCLLASATASGSAASKDVQEKVAIIREKVAATLRERIDRDVSSGLLPEHTDATALAWMVVALIQGMSTLARDGVVRADLIAMTNAALEGWPT